MKIRDQTKKEHLVVGFYYMPPDHAEPVNEAFLLQLQEALRSKPLILVVDFSHMGVVEKKHGKLQAIWETPGEH